VTLANLTIQNGEDASQTTIAGARLNVNGRLNVLGGGATDLLSVTTQTQDGTITGDVDIDLGRGDNQRATLQALSNNARLNLGGTLAIVTNDNTAGGTDTITLSRIGVRLRTTILTGTGNDVIAVDDADFDRFILDSGAGNDTINLDRGAFNGTTRFYAAMSIHTRAGNDTVNVGTAGSASNQVIFAGSRMFHGGDGHDTLNVLVSGNAIAFGHALIPLQFEVMN
jgi:hypothetical protein